MALWHAPPNPGRTTAAPPQPGAVGNSLLRFVIVNSTVVFLPGGRPRDPAAGTPRGWRAPGPPKAVAPADQSAERAHHPAHREPERGRQDEDHDHLHHRRARARRGGQDDHGQGTAAGRRPCSWGSLPLSLPETHPALEGGQGGRGGRRPWARRGTLTTGPRGPAGGELPGLHLAVAAAPPLGRGEEALLRQHLRRSDPVLVRVPGQHAPAGHHPAHRPVRGARGAEGGETTGFLWALPILRPRRPAGAGGPGIGSGGPRWELSARGPALGAAFRCPGSYAGCVA